jgi:hypothetical protein
MKITLQAHDNIYTVESKHDSLEIGDMAELFRGLLVQTGFHPATAEAAFNPEIFQYGSWDLEMGEAVRDIDPKEDAEIINKIMKK